MTVSGARLRNTGGSLNAEAATSVQGCPAERRSIVPDRVAAEAIMQSRMSMGMVVALFAGLLLPGSAAAQFGGGQKYLGAHVGLSGVGPRRRSA